MILWLGMVLSSQWVQSVFGMPSVVQVNTDRATFLVLDTLLNNRITNIMNLIHAERHRCMRVSRLIQLIWLASIDCDKVINCNAIVHYK